MTIVKVFACTCSAYFGYCEDIVVQKSDMFSSCLNTFFMDVLFTKLRNLFSISSGIGNV